MSPAPVQNTCENCAYWIRRDAERGNCVRYAPSPMPVCTPEKTVERPITYQFTPACGDWKKKS